MTQIEALKQIAARDGGLLRPQAVVDAARDEDSPLHGAFEWDDGIAAERYRLDQAQRLIRSFRVVVEDGNRNYSVPVFTGVSTDRTGARGENPYRLSSEVAQNADLLRIAEADALRQLAEMKERYSHLRRFSRIWEAIEDAVDNA